MVALRLAIATSIKITKLVAIGTPWTSNDLKDISALLSKVTPESWREKFPESNHLYKKLNPEIDFEVLTKELKAMWLDDGTSVDVLIGASKV